MADIKVKDLADTSSIALDNQIMVLTNDAQNQVQNITVENLLTNVLSSDNGNVLEQGTDGKFYVENPENITGNLADLATVNKTSLVNAINEVDSDISTEVTNRVNAVSGEATTRANADNNLQSQIDAITSASDVTDIVGTYAQLQAYDTTGLPDNSIIKVLQDESRQDETTYYRWVITGGVGAWVLIGEEGPYYTKSQADSLFATQQTTGNLASLDTSDKTSLVNAINELSSVLDPTQTADYINNSKAVESGSVSSNSIVYADIKKYAHSSFDLSKFTVVGSPTITSDGIASGFSASNFVGVQNALSQNKTFHIKLSWHSGDTISQAANIWQQNCFISLNRGNNGFCVGQRQGRLQLSYAYTLNNEQQIIPNGLYGRDNVFTTNSDYLIEFIFTGTEYKFIVNNELIYSFESTLFPSISNNYITIGVYGTNGGVITGSIDLKQFSIEADGIPVFSGNKTGIDTIKPDDYEIVGSPIISEDGVATVTPSTDAISFYNISSVGSSHNWDLYLPFTVTEDLYNRPNNTWIYRNGDICLGQWYAAPNNSFSIYLRDGNASTGFSLGFGSINLSLNDNVIIHIKHIVSTKSVYAELIVNGISTHQRSTSYSGTLYWYNVPIVTNNRNNWYLASGSIGYDLNAFKFYVDGNLIYQPCLKIPYTAGSNQYGGKYVNVVYRNRVKDAYEQGLANDYFTIDEENQNFTLPMGEVYGMIGDKVSKKGDTMTGTLDLNRQYSESGGPQYLRFNNTEYDFNNPPEGHLNEYLTFYDKNGIDIATIQHRFGTDYNDLFLRVRPLGDTTTSISGLPGLAMRTLANGDTFAYAPASDVVHSILTTAGITKASNGYVKLGNGIIIQWGANLTASSKNPTITFPTAFSSSNYFAMAYGREAANWDHTWGFKNSATATSCKFYFDNGDKFQWIAIGY